MGSVGIEPFAPFYWYNRPLQGRISSRGGSQQAYRDSIKGIKYVGKLKPWTGEPVWETHKTPREFIPRPW